MLWLKTLPKDRNLTAIRIYDLIDDPNKRGLTGAIWAQQPKNGMLRYVQANIIEGYMVCIALANLVDN